MSFKICLEGGITLLTPTIENIIFLSSAMFFYFLSQRTTDYSQQSLSTIIFNFQFSTFNFVLIASSIIFVAFSQS